MTEFDWLALDPDERIEWEASPRLMRAAFGFIVSVALVAAALAGSVVVDPLALAILVVAPIPAIAAYLRVVNTEFVVTNRACHRKTGIVARTVRTVELDRVQNTRSRQGVLGTLFDYGNVDIEVAGGRDLQFFDVYDPDDVRGLVERLADRRDGVPGTTAQWREVRDELRAIRQVLEID